MRHFIRERYKPTNSSREYATLLDLGCAVAGWFRVAMRSFSWAEAECGP
jgi:hypothetical protein